MITSASINFGKHLKRIKKKEFKLKTIFKKELKKNKDF